MNREPRRRASGWTSPVPIALLICLVALIALLPLLRGSASGARPDESKPKGVRPPSPTPVPAAAHAGVHALGRLEPEAGVVNVGVRPGARIERIMVKEG